MRDSTYQLWSPQARALWAKTGDGVNWMNLPQHLIDSSAVGLKLWDEWLPSGQKQFLANSTSLTLGETRILVSWLAGTHDLGKAAKAFAAQPTWNTPGEPFYDRIRTAGLDLPFGINPADQYHHSTASQVIIQEWLTRRFQVSGRMGRRVVRSVAEISGAHHGLPAFSGQVLDAKLLILEGHSNEWRTVQDEILNRITEITGAASVLKKLVAQSPIPQTAQMLLTGLVIMADWIASNENYFPLSISGDHFGEDMSQRADAAFDQLAFPAPWNPSSFENVDGTAVYRERFDWPDSYKANAMQLAALEISQQQTGPALICIEAPMGSGKTEAALVGSEVLAQRCGRAGIVFGLPTMATSDSAFDRVMKWSKNARQAELSSMYLGHSKNKLNDTFAELARESKYQSWDSNEPHRGGVIAHEWMSGRKTGLLADSVVGTVDQVLMLALQHKHAMLRHLALTNKVVIIDEVHAYDAYSSDYLERALEWLGASQVPVILLSATLPHQTKSRLLAAYWSAVSGETHTAVEIPDAGVLYPAITTVNSGSAKLLAPEVDEDRGLNVEINLVPDDDRTLEKLMQPVAKYGGCLLVLCNTVSRAQEAYELAKSLVGEDASLLHAQFAAIDRVEAERKLVRALGKNSTRGDGRPKRSVVVATQVVEQSLDLDFDAIVTDVAPGDLLLQRIGRVHRHARPLEDRPAWAKQAKAYIRGFKQLPNVDTAPDFVDSIQKIYDRSLLITTSAVFLDVTENQPLALPQMIPQIVRDVYSSDPQLPGRWQSEFDSAMDLDLANQRSSRARAKTYQFMRPDSSSGSAGFAELWQHGRNEVDEARGFAQVRDIQPTIEVVLTQARAHGYRPLPWVGRGHEETVLIPGAEVELRIARDLAVSTVRLPFVFSREDKFEQALNELEQATDIGWQASPYLKGQLQLLLDENYTATLAGIRLKYDRELGLVQKIDRKEKI